MSLGSLDPLIGLGLTRNQAKIYLAVALSRANTIKAISKIAEIPLESIYRTMSALEELNLVERTLTKPAKFRAMPIKEAISMLTAKDKKERNNVYKKANTLVENVITSVSLDQVQERDDEITIMPGLAAFLHQTGLALEKAKDLFQGITFPEKFRMGMIYKGKIFSESVKRGVECRHIVTYPEESQSYELGDKHLLENPLWIRKSVSSIPIDFVIIDQKELFIAITFRQMGKKHIALRTTSPCLLTLASNYYETLWNSDIPSVSN